MKKMTLVMSMMLTIMMFAAPCVYADTIAAGDVIQLYDKPGYGDTNGGAFELYKGGAYQFDTFCLEMNEYFYYGENLRVASITQEARNGGVGGAVYNSTTGQWSDPLSQQTAYLYYNFRMNSLGSLTGGLFNYTAGNASANALQAAIWYLEGETTAPLSGLALTLWNTANSASATALQTAYNNVGVLNLTRSTGENGQDQLTLIPTVPEPATMLLFGLGLIGLAGARRIIKN
jgi:hypothetical protein